MTERIVKLSGVLCSGCRVLLATPRDLSVADWNSAAPCWCFRCRPAVRPTAALRTVSGRIVGVVALTT